MHIAANKIRALQSHKKLVRFTKARYPERSVLMRLLYQFSTYTSRRLQFHFQLKFKFKTYVKALLLHMF